MVAITAPLATTHRTLVAATVDTVTFTPDYQFVEVLNRDAAADIYFTITSTATPTVGGDGFFIVQAGTSLRVDANDSASGTTVKLISSGAAAYSITCSN